MSRLQSLLSSLPPDFPPSSPLDKHDKSLCCPICQEMFDSPVDILCGHVFCSRVSFFCRIGVSFPTLMAMQCIRDAMQAKNKNCPTCQEPMREGDIRRNRIIEDLVESWTAVRYVGVCPVSDLSVIAVLIKQQPQCTHRPELIEWTSHNLKRKRSNERQVISPAKRDRKRSTPGGFTDRPTLNTKPGSRSVEVVELLDDSDEEQVTKVVTRNIRSSSDRAGSGEVEVERYVDGENGDLSSDQDPSSSISCPVCSRPVSMDKINIHLDRNCSSDGLTQNPGKGPKQSAKTSWAKLFAGTAAPSGASTSADPGGRKEFDNLKRIVKPNYHLASQKELRGICETHGISTHGDKPVLVERLQMWISMYK